MTSRDEALRALEKAKGQAHEFSWDLEVVPMSVVQAILATASEQAPVAWVIRDSATGKMVWDFEATVFDSEGDVHEFIGQLQDDDENVEGLEPAAVSFSSPAHTSAARDALLIAGGKLRAAMEMQEGRELETLHISQPTAKFLWDNAKKAWDDAAMLQEAGSRD